MVESVSAIEPALSPPIPTSSSARVLKVILGGDANVGKTSLIRRYCTGVFDTARSMTIGVDFHAYQVEVEQTPVRLMVWDLGGQERFAPARRGFYRGTHAVGLVFDASNRHSFYNLMRWWREVREHLCDVPLVLLANKTDLPRQISHEESSALACAWSIPFFESSCVTGSGVGEFFHALALNAWEHAHPKRPSRPIKFRDFVPKKTGEDR